MLNFLSGFTKRVTIFATLVGVSILSGCVSSSTHNPSTQLKTVETEFALNTDEIVSANRKAHVTRTGEAYLMRGLANVFSRGMDAMAQQLRSKGVDAVSFNHSNWKPIAQEILTRAKAGNVSYPIVIMGHSLGGNQSSHFANYLASSGVEVEFVATFDPTVTGYIGPNVKEVINYYLPREADNRLKAKAGFTGKLQNIDVTFDPEITHTNVEKNAAFQAASIKKILKVTKAL